MHDIKLALGIKSYYIQASIFRTLMINIPLGTSIIINSSSGSRQGHNAVIPHPHEYVFTIYAAAHARTLVIRITRTEEKYQPKPPVSHFRAY